MLFLQWVKCDLWRLQFVHNKDYSLNSLRDSVSMSPSAGCLKNWYRKRGNISRYWDKLSNSGDTTSSLSGSDSSLLQVSCVTKSHTLIDLDLLIMPFTLSLFTLKLYVQGLYATIIEKVFNSPLSDFPCPFLTSGVYNQFIEQSKYKFCKKKLTCRHAVYCLHRQPPKYHRTQECCAVVFWNEEAKSSVILMFVCFL